ncbi:MAG TPA: hypothetical protein VFR97_00485 [Capillimicrobium sp.]|nr:hypothetical protein [Capillimicrobium sp.]
MAIDAEQREWEQRLRVPAAVCAVLAGVLTLVGSFILTTLPSAPAIGVLQALTPAFEGRPDATDNPRAAIVEWRDDNMGTLLLSSVFTALGLLCMGVVLLYLYRATASRREGTPRVTRYAIYFGPIVCAIAGVAVTLALGAQASDFLSGTDRSRDAVEDALAGGPIAVLAGFQYAGLLALAVATVLVALNAMRAGLLTRFMGVLGIIVGVLFVIQFGALPLVQAVWLVGLAPLLMQRWPGGQPPAWERGEAVPWPSQQELREARMRAAEQRTGAAAVDDAAEPAPAPKPSAASRKRKRRR